MVRTSYLFGGMTKTTTMMMIFVSVISTCWVWYL